MLTLPRIVEREAQPYLALPFTTTMDELSTGVPGRIETFFERLAARGEVPAGPLFFRYVVIDMARELELEIGTPTRALLQGDEVLRAGTLPGGRFATVSYVGDYDGLYEVNTVLIGWARQKELRWDSVETPKGDRFGCRLEIYHKGPESEADPAKWETEVTIRLASD